MTEPRWLTPEEVIEINEATVAETGEPFLVRDFGLLASACHRPQNLFYYDGVEEIWSLAVDLLFAIARNHPFEQGNKRTGFLAAVTFLQLNGYDLVVDDMDVIADLIVEGLTDEQAIDIFERGLSDYVQPLDEDE